LVDKNNLVTKWAESMLNKSWKYLVLVLLIIAAYSPTFTGKFILDDNALIKNNSFIREPHSIAAYFSQEDGITDSSDLGEYHSNYFRPLINMTYRLDYRLWGLNSTGFRITNLVLHILCCFLLLIIFSHLLDKQSAFFITLIFALHPVNTESVSFVTSRNNIIVTLFMLGSLATYLAGWERKNFPVYIISIFLFAGAVFSKEFGLMVIPIIFLCQRVLVKQRHDFKKELISYVPFLAITAFYFMLRKDVTGSILNLSSTENIWTRLYFSPLIIFYDLQLILLPHRLHFIDFYYPANIFNWYAMTAAFLFVLLCFVLWKIRDHKLFIFSALGFLACVSPTLNIIPHQSISLISMRWLYASIGFLLIAVGVMIQKAIIAKRDLAVSIMIIVVIYLGGYTYVLNKNLWHDDDTLMKHEVFGFNNYLFASDIAEKFFKNKQYPEAEKYYRIAIEKNPELPMSYINYSAFLIETGRSVDAASLLNKAKALIMTHYEQGEWNNNMGTALLRLGKSEDSLKYFKEAVNNAPKEPTFWQNLGGLYGMMGDYKSSIEALEKGIKNSPDSIALRTNLAMSYINLKEYENAVSVLESLPENKRNDIALRLLKSAQEAMRIDSTGQEVNEKQPHRSD
jgi:protein O-mannosyl-transferase